MMMEKVLVVVNFENKETFEGKNIEVKFSGDTLNARMEIYDGDKLLAQFSEWKYWREL